MRLRWITILGMRNARGLVALFQLSSACAVEDDASTRGNDS